MICNTILNYVNLTKNWHHLYSAVVNDDAVRCPLSSGFSMDTQTNLFATTLQVFRHNSRKTSNPMKTKGKSIEQLNRTLKDELTAINQYFMHARMLKHWGLNKLNEQEYGYSIEAMKHADSLINRILFLEGLPNLQDIGKLLIGEDVKEILKNDLALLKEHVDRLLKAIAQCESDNDFVSREHFEVILHNHEEQLDWLETQLSLIDDVGLENYLQSQM